MSFFSEASLAMIPSGYKTSKVYSAIPTSGDGDLTFSRSNDTATRVGPDGLIEKVRTNIVLYSEQYDNAYWIKYNSTVTANTSETTDPIGGNSADILVSANATAGTGIEGNVTYTSGAETTISVYVKYKNTAFIQMLVPSFVSVDFVNFNIQTGAIVGGSYSRTPTITSVGNGWYRCSFTFVSAYSGTTAASSCYLVDSGSATRGQVFTGDGVKAVYIFGAQAETGVMTDYIATTSAAVTVGPVANVPRLDYLDSSYPRLLLEPQRANLALQSDSVTTSTTNVGYTATSNAATSPDGYASADQILEDTSTLHLVQKEFSVGSTTDTYAVSFFVKANGRTSGRIIYGLNAAPFSSVTAIFNLTDGTIEAATAEGGATAGTSKIENYGNGWYRISISGIIGIAGTHYARLQDTNGGVAGDPTKGFYVWGFQAEAGAYATSYIPTLGASVTRGADAASKTGISSLIGQTEGTIFAEINFDLGVTAQGDSRIQLSDGTASNWIFIGLPDGASGNLIRMYVNTPSSSMTAYSTNPVVNGVNKIAFGYKSGSFVLYVNGVQAATSSTTLTMAACSRIDLQGSVPAASAQERTNYKQLLLFTSRLSNDDLATLTTI
jgi:hypothetical protein